MRNITKQEYIVLQLYAKGLTFKDIGLAMNIAKRTAINFYMRVKKKDKGRVTRAKKSRLYNKSELKLLIDADLNMMKDIKYSNATYRTKYKELSIADTKRYTILKYIDECILFAHQSYNRFIVNLKKKETKKGAY